MKDNTVLGDKKLVLFFTLGISLRIWNETGMLDREIGIYKRLLPHFNGVSFITYGNKTEQSFAPRLNGIKILANRWRLSHKIFSILAPLLYWREMKAAALLKTNQLPGSWTAIIAKIIFRKKLITRCGYLWSAVYRNEKKSRYGNFMVGLLERLAFKAADRGIVTTEAMKKYVVKNYKVDETKISIIPNFVNTEVFKPMPEIKKEKGRLCFVGRLAPEKNLFSLLEAVKGLDKVKLALVGSGLQERVLKEKAEIEHINVEFLGSIPNYQLPAELNRAELFIFPSLYEGHPKTILEAMACQLPVIGTDVEGVRETITHKETGYLCGTSAEEIRRAIIEVMNNDELKTRMGGEARKYIVQNLSIEKILEKELTVLRSMVVKGK